MENALPRAQRCSTRAGTEYLACLRRPCTKPCCMLPVAWVRACSGVQNVRHFDLVHA